MGELTDMSGRSLPRTDADVNRFPRRERGAALIGSVLGVLILSMVGTVSVNLAVQEIESVQGMRDAAIARHLAEAGADLVMTWFHDSAAGPAGAGELFKKRYDRPDSGPSFFDAQGRSQFTGTADRPDLAFDATRAADHRLLNDPASGWFRGLRGLGEVRKLKVYGPSRPGLLCTVAVTASAGKLTKTLAFQLAANDMAALRSAVEVGVHGEPQASDSVVPLWVHWGEVRVKGDVHLPDRNEIPAKTPLASLSGWSYADMLRREDRWLEIRVGGDVFYPPSAPGVARQPDPANVLPRQDPLPGLRLDRWDYERMKKQARAGMAPTTPWIGRVCSIETGRSRRGPASGRRNCSAPSPAGTIRGSSSSIPWMDANRSRQTWGPYHWSPSIWKGSSSSMATSTSNPKEAAALCRRSLLPQEARPIRTGLARACRCN
nr:pilus assembly PilX N-terminal domain-containing protein [Nitrospirota bacterium]